MISVIVPVYKVEPYLDRCVRSIVEQTYTDLEIILVDDGSPDNCPAMCDAWAKRDNRIKVIHQANKGSGAARNCALDIAQGDLISFVDSDDYIAPTMFEFLYCCFSSDIDIVECEYCIAQDDNIDFNLYSAQYSKQKCTNAEAMLQNIKNTAFKQIIWNKLYRRNIIADIRFPTHTKIDDEFWTYRVISNCQNLVHTDKVLYAYRQQSNSVMHLLSTNERFQAIEAKIDRHKYICHKIPVLKDESIINLWFFCLYQGQYLLRSVDKKERALFWQQLKIVLRDYPITEACLNIPPIQIFWLQLARINFAWTCRLRNWLQIGT